jgi:hypothetical protein
MPVAIAHQVRTHQDAVNGRPSTGGCLYAGAVYSANGVHLYLLWFERE